MAGAASDTSAAVESPASDLKGRPFTLTVLRILRPDPERVGAEVASRLRQLPGFFDSAPVVVELAREVTPDIGALKEILGKVRDCGLQLVAINGGEAVRELAAAEGLCVLNERGRAEPAKRGAAPGVSATRVVKGPVRSGQQIVAEADVVVLGSVGDGAEVLANGNVHIYGTARGRVLAGLQGERSARIFCQALEAELISIAGYYRNCDDLEPDLRGRPVQVFLDGESLCVEALQQA